MQRLINLRDSVNTLTVHMICLNKTICDVIDVYNNPSDIPEVDVQLVDVLTKKLGLQLDGMEPSLSAFVDALERLKPDD